MLVSRRHCGNDFGSVRHRLFHLEIVYHAKVSRYCRGNAGHRPPWDGVERARPVARQAASALAAVRGDAMRGAIDLKEVTLAFGQGPNAVIAFQKLSLSLRPGDFL